MVVIRLARGGSKKRPFYHVVAADKRNARDGRNIEQLGYFNPVCKGQEIRLHLDMDRINYWLGQGAQPSDRVASLIKENHKGPEAVAVARTKKAEKLAKKKMAAKAAKSSPATESTESTASAESTESEETSTEK